MLYSVLCSNAPKRGKKCDEFKSLYQNIIKLLFLWTYQPPSKKNTTTSNSTSHGHEVRNLAKVPYWQRTCPSPSAHLLGMFGHGSKSVPPLRAQTLKYNSSLNATCKFWWNITKDTRAGAPAVNSVYSLCLTNTLSYHSILREKMLLFWSLHFLSTFFHKISSKVFRNILKIKILIFFQLLFENSKFLWL